MQLKTLSKNNFNKFKEMNSKRKKFNDFNIDFFNETKSKNYISKYISMKKVSILSNGTVDIGYIWQVQQNRGIARIESIYLEGPYINENNIKLLVGDKKDCILHFKGEEKNLNVILNSGFEYKTKTIVLKCHLKKKFQIEQGSLSFSLLKIGKDEKTRLLVQNDIFNNKDRIPLTIDDIYYDELQKYYYNEGAIFLKLKNKVIGYGQIIIDQGKPYIVNFGILNEYREKGYGRILLRFLLNTIIDAGFSYSYIKVDKNNTKAINLYKSIGYKETEENYILVKNQR